MGCACSKGRKTNSGLAAGTTFVYDFTAPDSETVQTFGTPLEAKTAVRRNGGGTVRRRTISTAS